MAGASADGRGRRNAAHAHACFGEACCIGRFGKSPRLRGRRRHEEALAEHSAFYDQGLAAPPPHSTPVSKDRRKQSAASPVVNKTGTQPCKPSSNSYGAGHAVDSLQQWASRRSHNDRALGSHPRSDQRGHLRRSRSGRLPHPLGWSARHRRDATLSGSAGVSLRRICRTRARPRRRRPSRNPCNRDRWPARAI